LRLNLDGPGLGRFGMSLQETGSVPSSIGVGERGDVAETEVMAAGGHEMIYDKEDMTKDQRSFRPHPGDDLRMRCELIRPGRKRHVSRDLS
jgi:hypothetical protein